MVISRADIKREYPSIHKFHDYTIPSGANQGDVFDPAGMTLVAIITPATITGATFYFDSGNGDGHGDMRPMTDAEGTAHEATITASAYIVLDPSVYQAARFFRIRSNVAQAQDTTLTLVFRPV